MSFNLSQSPDEEIVKKIITKYIFKDSISRVFTAFIDFKQEKISELFSDICGPPQMVIGENTYELNCEFNLNWKDYAFLNFKCTEVIEKEYYKKITWNVHAAELKVKYDYILEFYSNTLDKSTLFIWTMDYEEPDKNPMTKTMIDGFKLIRYDVLKKMEKMLENYYEDLIQCESTAINAKKVDIWKLITNWKRFREICPSIADEVECDGEGDIINTKVKLMYSKNKSVCYLKVFKVECKDNENIWTYELECYEGVPKVPRQILTFTFIQYENETFISFKHTFKEYIKPAHIESISNQKIQILNSLKNHFES